MAVNLGQQLYMFTVEDGTAATHKSLVSSG